MNPFLLPSGERLADWRQFRTSLTDQPDRQQLAAVAAYWSQAPLIKLAYDLDRCDTWPTIWEMIHANQWCRNTIAIGMEATLRLADVAADRLLLRLIHDRMIQDIIMILVVDDHWVLNYDWGSLCAYPVTEHYIMREWRYTGRGYSTLDG
jgi:hypothetical protein